jgi:predicted secreted protein
MKPEQINRANDLEERKIRLEEQQMKIELAKALGDVDALREVMQSISKEQPRNNLLEERSTKSEQMKRANDLEERKIRLDSEEQK